MTGSNDHDLTPRQFRWGLAAAYALHIVILALFVFEVIPQQYHAVGRPFWLHHGGDNVGYFNLARDLLEGTLQPNKYPLGFPILLVPFIAIFQPPDQQDLLEVVSAFWGIFMFPLGQLLLAWLARQLTGRRWLALCSVCLWTALPLLLYYGLRLVTTPAVAEVSAVHLMWAQMLSDGPATLFTLLVVVVFWAGRESGRARWALGLGALAGFLALIRLTSALTGGLVGLMLVWARRWQAALLVALSALVVFLPQMLYNGHFFGGPLTTGYQVLDEIPASGLFSPAYLTNAISAAWSRLGLLLPLLAAVGGGVVAIGLRFIWLRSRAGAILLLAWIVSYAGIYAVYYYSWTGGLTRFLMPVYPALAVVAAGVIGALVEGWQRPGRAGPSAQQAGEQR